MIGRLRCRVPSALPIMEAILPPFRAIAVHFAKNRRFQGESCELEHRRFPKNTLILCWGKRDWFVANPAISLVLG